MQRQEKIKVKMPSKENQLISFCSRAIFASFMVRWSTSNERRTSSLSTRPSPTTMAKP